MGEKSLKKGHSINEVVPNSLDSNENLLTRRGFMGLAALAVLGLKGDFGSRVLNTVSPKPQDPLPMKNATQPESLKNVPAQKISFMGQYSELIKDIPVPSVEMTDEQYEYPLPDGLNISKEDFLLMSEEVTQWAVSEWNTKYMPSLQSGALTIAQVVNGFVTALTQHIANYSPQSYRATMEVYKKFQILGSYQGLPLMMHYLNSYLNPAGVYIEPNDNDDVTGKAVSKFYSIDKVKVAQVIAGNESVKAPVKYLNSGVVAKEWKAQKVNYKQAFVEQPKLNSVCLFDQAGLEGVRASLKTFASLGIIYESSLEEFHKKAKKEFLEHELVHVLLAYLFPKSCGENSSSVKSKVEVTINIGQYAWTNEIEFMPIEANEVAANGYQIATSSYDVPPQMIMLLWGDASGTTYTVLSKLLPIAMLAMAEESDLKQKCVMGKKDTMTADFIALAKYMAKRDPNYHKKVGEYLYKIGYTLLQKVETGDIKTVKIPR